MIELKLITKVSTRKLKIQNTRQDTEYITTHSQDESESRFISCEPQQGQKAAQKQVKDSNGNFVTKSEIRLNNGATIPVGTNIKVSSYKIHYKYKAK